MGKKFIWSADNPEGVLSDLTAEEQAEIDALVAAKNIEPAYVIDRRQAYPSIGDQLDMLFHDIEANNLSGGDWITAIREVKTNNPKPE